jgi:hypothetical protein
LAVVGVEVKHSQQLREHQVGGQVVSVRRQFILLPVKQQLLL